MSNREKLLKAARECLLTLGFERTTVRHLVAASGANQASINYHFGSKEQLLTEALRALNLEWSAVLNTALGDESDADERDPESVWGRILASIQENRPLWFVNFESLSSAYLDDGIRAMIAEGQRAAKPVLARAFGADESEGSHYYALLVGVAAQWLIDPDGAPSAADIAASSAPSRKTLPAGRDAPSADVVQ